MQPETVDNLITNFEQSVVLREEELGTATVQSESSSSAKLKRRSFAKKKPLARVTLIKTSSFDGGSFHTAKTINRRAAVRKMGNPSTMAGMTNMAKGHNFAERNSEVPGTFSPRTSLRRQKSISAESLAGIRSSSESDRRVTEDRVNRTQATGEIVPDHMTKDDKCKDIDDRNRQTSTHMTYEGIVLPRRSKCLGSISDIDYGEENEVFVLDKTEEKSDTSCRGQIDTQGEGMADEEQADGLLQKVSSLDEDQKTQGNIFSVLYLFMSNSGIVGNTFVSQV